MRTFLSNVKDLPGVAANVECAMEVPVGNNIHELLLSFRIADGSIATKANVIADVASIRVVIVSKLPDEGTITLIDDLTPTELYMLDAFEKGNRTGYTQDGVLPIDFRRYKTPAGVAEDAYSIGTRDLETMTLIVRYNNTTLATSKCEVARLIDKEPRRSLNQHVRVVRKSRTFAGTGEESIDNLVEVGNQQVGLLAIHVNKAYTVLGSAIFRLDDTFVREYLDFSRNLRLLHENGRTQVSGFMHYDFMQNNDWLQIGLAETFYSKFVWTSAPGAHRVLLEEVHGLGKKNG